MRSKLAVLALIYSIVGQVISFSGVVSADIYTQRLLERIGRGVVSSGTSWDLDQYRALYRYSLPPGKTPNDIVGMGIAGSNDHVYVWYRDGTVSSGSSRALAQYRKPYRYSLPPGKTPSHIVGIGIAGSNDRVYVWYR